MRGKENSLSLPQRRSLWPRSHYSRPGVKEGGRYKIFSYSVGRCGGPDGNVWGGCDGWGFWGCLSFRGEMRDPKKTNVVTQNTSDEEKEAAALITDAGSHYLEMEKIWLRKVYWASRTREVSITITRDKVRVGKLTSWVRSARYFSGNILLDIYQLDLNLSIKRIFAVANCVILI